MVAPRVHGPGTGDRSLEGVVADRNRWRPGDCTAPRSNISMLPPDKSTTLPQEIGTTPAVVPASDDPPSAPSAELSVLASGGAPSETSPPSVDESPGPASRCSDAPSGEASLDASFVTPPTPQDHLTRPRFRRSCRRLRRWTRASPLPPLLRLRPNHNHSQRQQG
jgi:hypothetical protein